MYVCVCVCARVYVDDVVRLRVEPCVWMMWSD